MLIVRSLLFSLSFTSLSACVSSGPYGVNGVPLKRVNQKYVIATSTSVSLSGVDVSSIDDDFFAREVRAKQEGEEGFFAGADARGTVTSDARKAAQTKVDAALSANVNKVAMLESYLQAKFSLSSTDKPHMMKF
jgi:large subunit ribosomal protein L6e